MHVLRIWLTSGTQLELLYRGKGDVRTAWHKIAATVTSQADRLNAEPKPLWVTLTDDFGKAQELRADQIAGYQQSDYAAELEGALEIARAKQLATEKHQREMQKRHSLLVPQGPQMPGNGQIIAG